MCLSETLCKRWLAISLLGFLLIGGLPGMTSAQALFDQTYVTIQTDQTAHELPRFWDSTGFCPAELLLNPAMQQQLAWCGAVPHRGLVHVRIHNLVDLVTSTTDASGTISYNWSRLDEGLDVLNRNGLKPFFELMGVPDRSLAGFDNEEKLTRWGTFVTDLANHLISRYGLEEVRSWYFETVNEPDCADWWPDGKKPSPEYWLRYYEVSRDALHRGDPQLKFGGPGAVGGADSEFMDLLLAHCHQKNIPIDFISTHEKGGEGARGDQVDTRAIIRGEERLVELIRTKYPSLAEVPLMNNECDPLWSWNAHCDWRAKPYNAAIMAKIINQHRREFLAKGINYSLLSNDNGFLGGFYQRTLCALFLPDEKTPERFAMVRKPSLMAYEMLSLLGSQICAVEREPGVYDNLGIMATSRPDGGYTVVLSNTTDDSHTTGQSTIALKLNGLPHDKLWLVQWRVDENNGNPHQVWLEQGAPEIPSASQLADMAAQEHPGLSPMQELFPEQGRLDLLLTLPLPSLTVLLLLPDPSEGPSQLGGLRGETYSGTGPDREVLLLWDSPAGLSIGQYEIQRQSSPDSEFETLGKRAQISCGYLVRGHQPGFRYRVRAIDYWGNPSPWSEPIQVE